MTTNEEPSGTAVRGPRRHRSTCTVGFVLLVLFALSSCRSATTGHAERAGGRGPGGAGEPAGDIEVGDAPHAGLTWVSKLGLDGGALTYGCLRLGADSAEVEQCLEAELVLERGELLPWSASATLRGQAVDLGFDAELQLVSISWQIRDRENGVVALDWLPVIEQRVGPLRFVPSRHTQHATAEAALAAIGTALFAVERTSGHGILLKPTHGRIFVTDLEVVD